MPVMLPGETGSITWVCADATQLKLPNVVTSTHIPSIVACCSTIRSLLSDYDGYESATGKQRMAFGANVFK